MRRLLVITNPAAPPEQDFARQVFDHFGELCFLSQVTGQWPRPFDGSEGTLPIRSVRWRGRLIQSSVVEVSQN